MPCISLTYTPLLFMHILYIIRIFCITFLTHYTSSLHLLYILIIHTSILHSILHLLYYPIGISLTGGAGKAKSLEDALMKEDKLAPALTLKSKLPTNDSGTGTGGTSGGGSGGIVVPVVQHPIMLQIIEKVVAKLSRDSSIINFEIKGNIIYVYMCV